MHIPKISIGLPVYNGEKYLRPAIDSILAQDYADFELIICDNASTDRTSSICQEYAASDPRVRYYRNETNIGAARNYNRVLELARGGLFKWAAHDDVHLPGFLRRCVQVIEPAPPSVVLVAPRTEVIDEFGRKMPAEWRVETLDTRRAKPHQRLVDVLRQIEWVTAQFGLFRTEALRKTGGIAPFLASDWVLLVELAILGEIWEIPEVLFQRRWHPEISTNLNKTQSEFLKWFDPSQKAKVLLLPRLSPNMRPRFRVGFECARAIARLPMSRTERLLCFFWGFIIWTSRETRRLVLQYSRTFINKSKKAAALVRARLKQVSWVPKHGDRV